MATPEGKVKAKLDRMLKEEKVWYFPPQAGPYGRAGVPDRVLCLDGLFVGVEVKKDSNAELTALQKACRNAILQHGGVYFVVYDADTIAAVRDFIHACRRRQKETSCTA